MGIEIEAKFKVDTHDALRERLRQAGALFVGRYLETNQLFDRPDRSLTAAGCGLRVRAVQTLEGRAGPHLLTYKGPRELADLKVRPEIDVRIDDPDRAAELLRALGYRAILVFEKRRESWHLADAAIELDEVPEIGRFVEIEGPDEGAVRSARSALGLADETPVADTYVSLLIARTRGETPARFLFHKDGGAYGRRI